MGYSVDFNEEVLDGLPPMEDALETAVYQNSFTFSNNNRIEEREGHATEGGLRALEGGDHMLTLAEKRRQDKEKLEDATIDAAMSDMAKLQERLASGEIMIGGVIFDKEKLQEYTTKVLSDEQFAREQFDKFRKNTGLDTSYMVWYQFQAAMHDLSDDDPGNDAQAKDFLDGLKDESPDVYNEMILHQQKSVSKQSDKENRISLNDDTQPAQNYESIPMTGM